MRRSCCLPVLVLVGLVGVTIPAGAQPVPDTPIEPLPRELPARPIATSLLGSSIANIPRQTSPDPVGDGIGYGALIGAASGAGMMAVLYAKCDGSCEAPAPGPMYAWAMSVGAGAGALVGWLVDRGRQNVDRRVRVTAVVSPKQQNLRVAVRF